MKRVKNTSATKSAKRNRGETLQEALKRLNPNFTDVLEPRLPLDAYGPKADAQVGKVTSAYWKVGV